MDVFFFLFGVVDSEQGCQTSAWRGPNATGFADQPARSHLPR